MEKLLEEQLQNNPDKVKGVLNILLESPYFYRTDNDELFMYLRRYRGEFAVFFREYYGWELIIDEKCARVYKERWYNDAIPPSHRMQFNLTQRDECIAFMLLIEFFEHQLEENSMTVEDRNNLRFIFTDLLEYEARRFAELFSDSEKYTAEYIRANILRTLLPKLIKYRFILEVPKPQGMDLSRDQYIYEALPALYHYNSGRLGQGIFTDDQVENDNESGEKTDKDINDIDETDTHDSAMETEGLDSEESDDGTDSDSGITRLISELDEA